MFYKTHNAAKVSSEEEYKEALAKLDAQRRNSYWEKVVISGGMVSPHRIEGFLYMAEKALALALEADQDACYDSKEVTSALVKEFRQDVDALEELLAKYPGDAQMRWIPAI